MIITAIEKQDAADLLKLQLQLDKESSFMLYEYGERSNQIQAVKNMIEHYYDTGSLIAAAKARKDLAGFISAKRGQCNRNNHTAYVVIGVLSKYQGQGIGSSLMEHLLVWAKSNKITRLELTVMTHNSVAIALYKKYGFLQEGIKQRSLFVDGSYVDEYYMAKLM